MHRIEFSRGALKSLRKFPKDRAKQILVALEELASTDDPSAHHNVKAMKGTWSGLWRLRVGGYRVIFALSPVEKGEDELMLLLVEAIGTRGDTYKG